jgi:predicted ATPase
MHIVHLKLKNWRNFKSADIDLTSRSFLVGPNAAGKSNFLDVFKFLRDVAKAEGGGLQKAIRDRGGISKLRCLAARTDPEIVIEMTIADEDYDPSGDEPLWVYSLGIRQEPRGDRLPYVAFEKVLHRGRVVLDRPNSEDEKDRARLTQTDLEQVSANRKFRDVAKFLQSITYLHLVPQLIRYADKFQGNQLEDDPYGQGFLERVAKTTEKVRSSRLKRIEEALRVAVPQMKELRFARDEASGRPHLEALYVHWRPNAGWQREDQFSDGTLRLLGLLWCLLERDSLLLLEEPELSLNAAIVRKLPGIISRMQRTRDRQVLISTHSDDLLSDKGIDAGEVLLLQPNAEGTSIKPAASIPEVLELLNGGMSVGEAVLPLTASPTLSQLSMFDA